MPPNVRELFQGERLSLSERGERKKRKKRSHNLYLTLAHRECISRITKALSSLLISSHPFLFIFFLLFIRCLIWPPFKAKGGRENHPHHFPLSLSLSLDFNDSPLPELLSIPPPPPLLSLSSHQNSCCYCSFYI